MASNHWSNHQTVVSPGVTVGGLHKLVHSSTFTEWAAIGYTHTYTHAHTSMLLRSWLPRQPTCIIIS